MIAHGHFFGCPCVEFTEFHGVRYCVCCGLRAYPEKPVLPGTIDSNAGEVGPSPASINQPELEANRMSPDATTSTSAPAKVEQ